MARPKRGTTTKLPKEAQRKVEEAIIEGRPVNGDLIAEELKANGFSVSGSTVWRHAVRFREKVQATKDAVDRAKIITAAVDGAPGALSEAVVQTELFDVLVAIEAASYEDDPEKRLKILSMAANTISDLTRAANSPGTHSHPARPY